MHTVPAMFGLVPLMTFDLQIIQLKCFIPAEFYSIQNWFKNSNSLNLNWGLEILIWTKWTEIQTRLCN